MTCLSRPAEDLRFSARFVARNERHRRTQLRWSVGASGTDGWLEHPALAGSIHLPSARGVFAVRQKPRERQGATRAGSALLLAFTSIFFVMAVIHTTTANIVVVLARRRCLPHC